MKIETRADCIVCGADIVDARFRTYCSDKCRVKRNNIKNKEYNDKWRIEHKKVLSERAKMKRLQIKITKQNDK